MNHRPVCILCILALCLTLGAAGGVLAAVSPPARPLGEQRQAILQTVIRFADALDNADERAINSLIWAAQFADSLGRGSFASLVAKQKRLERIARERFGEAGRRFDCGYQLLLSEAERKALLTSATVIVYFDEIWTAEVSRPGDASPIILRFQDGGWRIALPFIDNYMEDDINALQQRTPSRASEIRLRRNERVAEAFDAVAAAVESGELASAEAAAADLLQRIHEINATMLKERAASGEFIRW
jgi:hypothetical protein